MPEQTLKGAQQAPVRVLFVCLGNICRSPMAEAVFRSMVERAGLADQIEVDSAGTGDYHIGEPPHPGTRRILQERGIAYTHTARMVSPADIDRFDYVVALDGANLAALRRLAGDAPVELRRLLEYAPGAVVQDVPDPYHTGGFERVYELIEQGCRGLLQQIIEARNLEPRTAG